MDADHARITDPTPDHLAVVAYKDEVIEHLGYAPGHHYIEAVWLGVLGPSATWCWQRLARVAASAGGGPILVDAVDLAVSLGLGEGLGRSAPITRCLGRIIRFDGARSNGATLAVRLALPPIAERRAERLSYSARLAHEHFTRQTQ
jgi:hypothetical protein